MKNTIGFSEARQQYYYVCPLNKCGRSHQFAYYPTREGAKNALDDHVRVCATTETPMTFR